MDSRKTDLSSQALAAAFSSVLAYQYKITIAVNTIGHRFRDREKVIEYYIPSLNICMNKYAVFKSDKARNAFKFLMDDPYVKPLTAVQLPKSLVDKISPLLEENVFHYFPVKNGENDWEVPFESDEQYASLFHSAEIPNRWSSTSTLLQAKKSDGTNTYKTIIGSIKKQDLNIFWEVHSVKKNRVLKKALLKYIEDGSTPEQVSLENLLHLIDSLDRTETESIKQSIEVHFQNIKELNRNNPNSESLLYSVYTNGLRLFSYMMNRNDQFETTKKTIEERTKIVFDRLDQGVAINNQMC